MHILPIIYSQRDRAVVKDIVDYFDKNLISTSLIDVGNQTSFLGEILQLSSLPNPSPVQAWIASSDFMQLEFNGRDEIIAGRNALGLAPPNFSKNPRLLILTDCESIKEWRVDGLLITSSREIGLGLFDTDLLTKIFGFQKRP